MLKVDVIGVGVIGAGRAGSVHARNFAENVPEAKLVSLFDLNGDAVKEAAASFGASGYTDLDKFLGNPALDANQE